MNENNFKIQGVGLDTSTIDYNPGSYSGNYDYYYTSISANNDYLLKDMIDEGTPVIVGVDFLESLENVLENHLRAIGRKKADLVLFSGNIKFDQAPETMPESLFESNLVGHCGIQSPVSVDQVKELREKYKIEYICIPLCPMEFDPDIIEYAEQEKIHLIITNPFGGYLSAARNIISFSVPYLLSFAATYGDIVLVSGRDLIKADTSRDFLNSLIGLPSNPGFRLTKAVNREVKEIKKAIFTSVKIDDYIVPYDSPENIIDQENFGFGFGKYIQSLPESIDFIKDIESADDIDREESTVAKEINHFLRVVHYPIDGSLDIQFAVARYKIIEYLDQKFPDYKKEFAKIGNRVLMVSLTSPVRITGHFLWKKVAKEETTMYYMILPLEGKDHIIFREVEETQSTED